MAQVNSNSNPTATQKENTFLNDLANLKLEDLVRGATIPNIERRCLDLCQAYIGGSWLQAQSIDAVTVKRITGGLTNQLYSIALNDSVPSVPNAIYPDEPRTVAIKLYQAKHFATGAANEHERLNDIIILTILSELDIGPKVYGIFNEGFIQDFVEVCLIALS